MCLHRYWGRTGGLPFLLPGSHKTPRPWGEEIIFVSSLIICSITMLKSHNILMYGHQHSIYRHRQCQTCMLTSIVCSIRKARVPCLLNVHLKHCFTYFFQILQIKPSIPKKCTRLNYIWIILWPIKQAQLQIPVTQTPTWANLRFKIPLTHLKFALLMFPRTTFEEWASDSSSSALRRTGVALLVIFSPSLWWRVLRCSNQL